MDTSSVTTFLWSRGLKVLHLMGLNPSRGIDRVFTFFCVAQPFVRRGLAIDCSHPRDLLNVYVVIASKLVAIAAGHRS